MSERLKNRLVVVALIGLASLLVFLVAANETQADRVERIGSSIKCPVCQGEAIADSPSPMATDMMSLVEQRVDEGASDEEIIDELLGSFSGAVLLDPPVSGITLGLWLAPLLALLGGLAVMAWWRAHPGDELGDRPAVGPPPETQRGNRRLIGGLILIGGFAAIVVTAGALLQDPPAAAEGAAAVGDVDLENASNETMEAVIAANLDHPLIAGMRLALAERYFEAGDYRSAFPHYLAVAESPTATEAEATTSLVRLGWMAYDGNGEVETALSLFDQALQISPGSQAALYLKGQVLWCGSGDPSTAAGIFERVLDDTLTAETRAQVEADLESASAGEGCG